MKGIVFLQLKMLCFTEYRRNSTYGAKSNHDQKFEVLREIRKIPQNKIIQENFKKSKTKTRTLGMKKHCIGWWTR